HPAVLVRRERAAGEPFEVLLELRARRGTSECQVDVRAGELEPVAIARGHRRTIPPAGLLQELAPRGRRVREHGRLILVAVRKDLALCTWVRGVVPDHQEVE